MKKTILLILLLPLLIGGCKRKDGDQGPPGARGSTGSQGLKGDTGSKGDTGPTEVVILTAIIPSNQFTVTDSRLNTNNQMNILVGSYTFDTWAELPYYLPSKGINTYFILSTGSVEIFNGLEAGGLSYIIQIIEPSSAPEYLPTNRIGDRFLW